MSENCGKNSNIARDSEIPDEGCYSKNNENHMKDPLNGEQNVKKVVSFGSPCQKDDNCGLIDNPNLDKKDISEGNHIKKTDVIGHCNKENMPKLKSEGKFHGPDAPVFPEDNAGVAKKSPDILTVSPGRRKQATPRKRNVNEAEKKFEAVKYCEKEIVPSINGKAENLRKERGQKSLNVNGKPKRNAKNTRKRGTPIEVDDFPNVSTSNKRRKPSDPKKKTLPKKVATPKAATPKAASAAKKCNAKKKAKNPTVAKEVTAPDLDCNHGAISGDVSKTHGSLNEEMPVKTQPAMSLKIICTPFNQNGVDDTPVKEETETPPVCTSRKRKTTLKNKEVSSPKKASKETKPNKNKAVAKKTSSPSALTKNKKDTKVVGAKAAVKKSSLKKSPVREHSDVACEPLPPKEEVILKKTRGRRKMKKSEEYVVAFMSESDDDIEPDFSEDEYLPSKDEDPYVREKEKAKEERKKNLRVSFSCFDEDDENSLDENYEKLQFSFESKNKSKKKTQLKFVESKPATKVQTSPTVSPTKKVKSPHRNKKEMGKSTKTEDGDSQNESGPDMPLLSPSKGRKTKQKKRKIRIQREKTLSDGLDNDATGEEDMTATEDEEGGLIKIRRRRKRYGEPYSVTGNWYIAQGYLLDISNLIEMFVKENGWRFRDFATCWQKLKFSQVYRGRQNFKELLELSEEIAFLTKRFIMPPHSTKARIGSLYALYGLYYKHPFRAFFKIRLLGDEYEQLVELIRPYQSNPENYDPAYIFRKLELDGAILHVAASLEMGIDFYNAEREAVDIKYESQRLANSSIVARTLLPEVLEGDDQILKQYYNTKVNVAGDGKEAEKLLSFVEASITEEVKELVKKLKEETLSILRLNDPPTAKVLPPTESEKNDSSIGARRAEIMAKAVKSDTSGDYLRKKCFREPAKVWGKPTKQVSLRQGLSDENDSSMSNRDVQDFMKIPIKETLSKPLVPQRRSQRRVVHKYIKRNVEEENEQIIASDAIDNESLNDQWQEQEGESSAVDEKVVNGTDPVSDELEILTKVPPVLPKPKRVRGPPRRKILSQAVEVNKADNILTSLQALKRKVSDEQLIEKRRKRRQLKKVEPDEESAVDLSRIIVGLPPVKVEASAVMVRDEVNEIPPCPELKPRENEERTKRENLQSTITLNIQLKGENIYKNQHFKILNNNWIAIQGNERKLDRLKKKLISIILPEHVKQTVDEDKVDVEITVLETEEPEIVCDTNTTFELRTDTSNINLVSSTIHDKNQVQVKNDVHYNSADEENIPLIIKTEKPDYSPQNKIYSTSDVIKDLQGMWESDSNDNGIESVDGDPLEFHSFVTKSEDSWSENASNEEHKFFPFSPINITKDCDEGGMSEDFHDDKSFVDLVSDVDDFEDESEPIILTQSMVTQRPGYSLNYNNIVPPGNNLKLSHLTAATPMFTTASLVGSPIKLKDKGMQTPLYKRADQATESHSSGPSNPASISKRYITYNSPLVVSGGQTPTLVPVSTSLPLLKSQGPQKSSFLLEQPSYVQLSSDSMRPRSPYSRSFTACGNSSSTPSHADYSSPESCLGSRILVSSHSATTVESQSPLICVPTPARFPGSVTVTPRRLTQASEISGISTSVTHAHNSTSVSPVGLHRHPDLGGVKLVKVKINNAHSVLIPENEIAMSATQMNVITNVGKEGYAKFSSPSSLEEIPSSVTIDDGNHSTEMDSVMTRGLPLSDVHHRTAVAQTSLVGQDGGLKCDSNSSWVSNDSKSSFSTTSSGKVCSFLFSPKFTKQSRMKNPTGEATGIPVAPKKLKVPFIFKHSLVPKKKSL
ncbi:uncharacterized protein [Palaemon carinicauda]|uniref:uncharacterized protein n=1 Tax=Palaemon carinicauda TaxID=392227 RepID=UPI0035B6823B